MAGTSGAAGQQAEQEVGPAWAELLSAAGEAGYSVSELVRPPASAAQRAAVEAAIGRSLPPDLTALYQLSDGQVDWVTLVRGAGRGPRRQHGQWTGSLFGDGWTFNSLEELRAQYQGWADMRAQYTPDELAEDFDSVIEVRDDDPVKPLYSCADWIPFATDGGGNSLASDLAPEPGGSVGQVIVIGSDEDLRRVVAPSIPALLRLCAARLRDPAMIPAAKDGVVLYTLETWPR